MKIILASKSPRRLELLSMLGHEVQTIVSEVDEASVVAPSPRLLAKELSYRKALAVYRSIDDRNTPIVAADTLVEINGIILGKPRDKADAIAMLKLLSGRKHHVHTGYTVIYNGKTISKYDTSTVYFRELTDNEITDYVESGEPFDKAGAYGIQGKAGAFVERIEGDFFSIMGLPICKISKALNTL